jgi:4-coumarate--CoA ligase (photoactive yellow protein activation family)
MGEELFAGAARDRLVAVGAPGSRTLGDLLRDAASVAQALPATGGEVLLCCEDRYLFAAGLLGAWSAGRAVALPPNAQPGTLRLLGARASGLLHDGAASHGIDLRTLLDAAPPSPERFAAAPPSLERSAAAPLPSVHSAAAPLFQDLAPSRHLVTVYTSGSTGPHQPCRKTAAQLLGEATLHARTFRIGPDDCILATVPAHHLYGLLFSVLVPLTAGARFVRTTPLLGEAVAAAIRTHRASVLVSVPAHLRSLALLDAAEFRGVRLLVSSAGALDAATRERIAHLGPDACEIFGSSETGGIATRAAAGDLGRADAGWTPLPGVRVEAGEGGQLLLDSPFLEADLPRPHPCQDRIALSPDGTFEHRGRLDDVVKIGGKRVSLSEVESRLREQPGVTSAAVVAVPSERHGAELRAAAAGQDLDPAALREALLRHFDATVVPRRVHVLARLPLLENGKLSRARLLALTGGGAHDLPARPLDGDGDRRRFEIPVRADLPWFRGHFDGAPILAGVVQLELIVVAQLRRAWPELGAVLRVTRLKFRRPIRPEQTLLLELVRDGAQVSFSLSRGAEICSSGTLLLGDGQDG